MQGYGSVQVSICYCIFEKTTNFHEVMRHIRISGSDFSFRLLHYKKLVAASTLTTAKYSSHCLPRRIFPPTSEVKFLFSIDHKDMN